MQGTFKGPLYLVTSSQERLQFKQNVYFYQQEICLSKRQHRAFQPRRKHGQSGPAGLLRSAVPACFTV